MLLFAIFSFINHFVIGADDVDNRATVVDTMRVHLRNFYKRNELNYREK